MTPWILYLNNHKSDALLVNLCGQQLFNCKSILTETEQIDVKASDLLYDKICDYLEVQGKDEKIKILMSQYGFFRNIGAVWLFLSLLILIFVLLHCIGYIEIVHPLFNLISALVITFSFFLISYLSMKKRKILAMTFVYRTFLALQINNQIKN